MVSDKVNLTIRFIGWKYDNPAHSLSIPITYFYQILDQSDKEVNYSAKVTLDADAAGNWGYYLATPEPNEIYYAPLAKKILPHLLSFICPILQSGKINEEAISLRLGNSETLCPPPNPDELAEVENFERIVAVDKKIQTLVFS